MIVVPRFGYIPQPPTHENVLGAKELLAAEPPPPDAYMQPYRSDLVEQAWQDCVARAVTCRMRARIVMQAWEQDHDAMPDAALPSARWAYWHHLDAQGKLGLDPGSMPFKLVDDLNRRGWCAERWCPYDAENPPTEENAPPPAAFRHAFDQRGRLQAHAVSNHMDLKRALAKDLGVVIGVPCDERFVTPGGVPSDPDYVWDFDDTKPHVGLHMMQADGYDQRGLFCQNTWGEDFGRDGYVRVGWKTILEAFWTVSLPIALDWCAEVSG